MAAELAHVADIFNTFNGCGHGLNSPGLQHAGGAQRELGLQQVLRQERPWPELRERLLQL